jgi:error-prone DNA polymerase
MPLAQQVLIDYSTAGLSLKRHPVSFVRQELSQRKIITAQMLKDPERFSHGRWVKVAGLVLVRQRPGTASGVVFITLEDETGSVNLILWSTIYDRYRLPARHARLLQADGYVQREGQVIHVLVKRLFDLSELLEGYMIPSRDFH